MSDKKKIVILGCENSHAKQFLTFMRDMDEFSDIEAIGVYSSYPDAAKQLSEEFGVPCLESYDAAEGIDGVIVTARHGNEHYKFAKPYISRGIPMFIDKPITVLEDDAVNMMREMKASGVRVVGGSSLKYAPAIAEAKASVLEGGVLSGYARAPVSMKNVYGNFYFYSQHLVEMVLEAFGRFPSSVYAKETGSAITVVFEYGEYNVIGLYTEGVYKYEIAVGKKDGTRLCEATTDNSIFVAELREYAELLRGGEMSLSYGEFISAVFVLNAIERSLASGVPCKVAYRE